MSSAVDDYRFCLYIVSIDNATATEPKMTTRAALPKGWKRVRTSWGGIHYDRVDGARVFDGTGRHSWGGRSWHVVTPDGSADAGYASRTEAISFLERHYPVAGATE